MDVLNSHAAVVEALRARIAVAERQGRAPSQAVALPFEVAPIDRHLPAGGLLFGAVHELQASGPDVETGAAPALFAAGVLARCPGSVVWIGRRGGVFAHGLLQAGLDPRRIVFVDAGGTVLLAMEEALRHPDVAGVVCELEGRLDLVVSRRLQLAAEGSQVLGFLLRRSRRFDDPALSQPSAAMTRWRIGTVPSPPALAHAPDVVGLHRPLWRLDLLRCRGGEPASWTVEGCDAQGRLAVAAVLANRASAPARRRAAG
jgi:protein ImuA